MKKFQIADLAGLCGINAHTIRMWENRYNLLSPGRDKGNYRTYSLNDLDYLLKIALLNRSRFRISQLACMDAAVIDQQLKKLNTSEEQHCRHVDRLIISMLAMNTEEFEAVLDSCVIHWGIDQTIKNIIIPFIERTKLFSCRDCEIETDFAITALRRKMILGIETTHPGSYKTKTLLLFLPRQEYFDLLILYSCYLARLHGFGVLYMGTNVCFSKVKHVTDIKQPDHLILYTSQNNMQDIFSQAYHIPNHITLLYATADKAAVPASNVSLLHFRELPHLLNAI